MKKMERNVGVSTFLWDTTFTAAFDIVNKQIRDKSVYPPDFDNSVKTDVLLDYLSQGNDMSYYQLLKQSINSNSSTVLKGIWGQWQLELRGNGNSIYLRLPVTEGKIIFDGEEGKLDGGYLIVMVSLLFESQKDNGNKRELVLGGRQNSQVSVVDHEFPQLDPESVLEDLVEGAFKRYLNTEKVLEQFRYVFSVIDINNQATGDFAWLKPSDTGYAVFVPGGTPAEKDSLFSILCMTENKIAPPYIQQSVDATVFDGKTEGANAVLCISPQRFCEKLLIASAKKIIAGTVDADYSYSSNGMEIHNVREITFKDVEVAKGDKVDLKIAANDFSIQLVNDHLQLSIYNASYSKTMYKAQITLQQRVEFETKTENNKTIFVLKEGEEFKGRINAMVEPTETAQIIKWVGVALDILSAVLVIAGGTMKVIAKCTTTATSAAASVANATIEAAEVAEATTAAVEGIRAGAGASRSVMIAGRLILASGLCVAIGLPFSLAETIAVEMGENKFENVPGLEKFAENFLSEITWTGIEKTTLVGARLNDALLMDFTLEDKKD